MSFRVKTRPKALRLGSPEAIHFEIRWNAIWSMFDVHMARDARRWIQ